jgi:hypothetical protein
MFNILGKLDTTCKSSVSGRFSCLTTNTEKMCFTKNIVGTLSTSVLPMERSNKKSVLPFRKSLGNLKFQVVLNQFLALFVLILTINSSIVPTIHVKTHTAVVWTGASRTTQLISTVRVIQNQQIPILDLNPVSDLNLPLFNDNHVHLKVIMFLN